MQPVRATDSWLSNKSRLGRGRPSRRAVAFIAGAGLALLGASATMSAPLRAQAATPTPVAAEGDSYALGGFVTVLGGDRIGVGPVAPSTATAPKPLNPDGLNVATFACNGSCVPSVVNSIDVTADTSKAFVPGLAGAPAQVATTECNPNATLLPTGFIDGPLTGGNACSNIAHVEIGGNTGVVADAVSVQSLTQSCTATPVGLTSVLDLFVGGVEIPILNSTAIPANDTISLPAPLDVTVILNEQHAENKSAPGPGGTTQNGHGMDVNAIHVIIGSQSILTAVAGLNIVIAHAHSDAICATPVTPLCTPGSSLAICTGVTITKLPDLPFGINGFTTPQGSTFSYTISIANDANCPVTQVTDILPVGFTLVSESGPLGTPTQVAGGGNGAQVWQWFNGLGWLSPDPLVEKITVHVSATEPPNIVYINMVQTLNDCGSNSASSPPVTVTGGPTPPPATATPTPSATPAATPTATPAAVAGVSVPSTGGGRPAAANLAAEGAPFAGAGLLLLASVLGLRRRRRPDEDITL